jgi:hypothetical protein
VDTVKRRSQETGKLVNTVGQKKNKKAKADDKGVAENKGKTVDRKINTGFVRPLL